MGGTSEFYTSMGGGHGTRLSMATFVYLFSVSLYLSNYHNTFVKAALLVPEFPSMHFPWLFALLQSILFLFKYRKTLWSGELS